MPSEIRLPYLPVPSDWAILSAETNEIELLF